MASHCAPQCLKKVSFLECFGLEQNNVVHQERPSVQHLCYSLNVKISPTSAKTATTATSMLISFAAAIVYNWWLLLSGLLPCFLQVLQSLLVLVSPASLIKLNGYGQFKIKWKCCHWRLAGRMCKVWEESKRTSCYVRLAGRATRITVRFFNITYISTTQANLPEFYDSLWLGYLCCDFLMQKRYLISLWLLWLEV